MREDYTESRKAWAREDAEFKRKYRVAAVVKYEKP